MTESAASNSSPKVKMSFNNITQDTIMKSIGLSLASRLSGNLLKLMD